MTPGSKTKSVASKPWSEHEHWLLVDMVNAQAQRERVDPEAAISWNTLMKSVSERLEEEGYTRTASSCTLYWKRHNLSVDQEDASEHTQSSTALGYRSQNLRDSPRHRSSTLPATSIGSHRTSVKNEPTGLGDNRPTVSLTPDRSGTATKGSTFQPNDDQRNILTRTVKIFPSPSIETCRHLAGEFNVDFFEIINWFESYRPKKIFKSPEEQGLTDLERLLRDIPRSGKVQGVLRPSTPISNNDRMLEHGGGLDNKAFKHPSLSDDEETPVRPIKKARTEQHFRAKSSSTPPMLQHDLDFDTTTGKVKKVAEYSYAPARDTPPRRSIPPTSIQDQTMGDEHKPFEVRMLEKFELELESLGEGKAAILKNLQKVTAYHNVAQENSRKVQKKYENELRRLEERRRKDLETASKEIKGLARLQADEHVKLERSNSEIEKKQKDRKLFQNMIDELSENK